MSHSIIIIDSKLADVIGDATEGQLFEYRANINALDEFYTINQEDEENEKVMTAHQLLEDAQACFVDGDFELAEVGFTDQVADWNTEITDIIG